MNDRQIASFVDAVTAAQGKPALSEAKVRRLSDPEARVVIVEDESIQAVGVAAQHVQASGPSVWEIETAVQPAMQFAPFEEHVLSATLELVPSNATVTVWSQRSSLDVALASLGFGERRVLAHMATDLPLTSAPPAGPVRSMRPDERETLVRLNNAAFEGHPEAGAMGESDIDMWRREGWFDESGVIFAEVGGTPEGFCVTKVHPNGDGEIYRVGVAPGARGVGLGTTLAVAAYDLLARDERTKRGTLWVDLANSGAVELYRSIGLEVTMVNREFARTSG